MQFGRLDHLPEVLEGCEGCVEREAPDALVLVLLGDFAQLCADAAYVDLLVLLFSFL